MLTLTLQDDGEYLSRGKRRQLLTGSGRVTEPRDINSLL